MILNLRGGSCSGKSTPVYRLLADHPHETLWEEGGWNLKKPRCVGYTVGNLLIIGPYEPSAKTGGLDMLSPGQIELCTIWLRERMNCGYKHVIYESLMASLAMGRYQQLARDTEYGPAGPTVFAFLDTPLAVRQERVRARTGGRGPRGTGINEEAFIQQHGRMQQIRQRFVEQNEIVVDLDHRFAYEQVLQLLLGAGWDPTTQSRLVTRPPTLLEIGRELTAHGAASPRWPATEAGQERVKKELAKLARRFET